MLSTSISEVLMSALIWRECIRGIGEDMLKRAFEILEQDEDNLEVNFLLKVDYTLLYCCLLLNITIVDGTMSGSSFMNEQLK